MEEICFAEDQEVRAGCWRVSRKLISEGGIFLFFRDNFLLQNFAKKSKIEIVSHEKSWKNYVFFWSKKILLNKLKNQNLILL